MAFCRYFTNHTRMRTSILCRFLKKNNLSLGMRHSFLRIKRSKISGNEFTWKKSWNFNKVKGFTHLITKTKLFKIKWNFLKGSLVIIQRWIGFRFRKYSAFINQDFVNETWLLLACTNWIEINDVSQASASYYFH